ncbi:MAG TPA: hypothetical protein VHY22_03430 [Chthoniobacteraceae bacterium]|jgi:hypothetical protein|nr:hypothetical protein [Chthoniobacteraceae bacterium]
MKRILLSILAVASLGMAVPASNADVYIVHHRHHHYYHHHHHIVIVPG